MNLWLRLLWLIMTAWHRPKFVLPHGISHLRFRVWLHDLDTALHLNNGRYWTLMDLGRIDLLIGSGLWRLVLRRRWTPVLSSGHIRFRRELRPFQTFTLETQLLYWDDTRFVIEQRFVFRKTNTLAATALVQAGLYDRKRRSFVPVQAMFEAVGIDLERPAITAEVEAFLAAGNAMRQASALAR